MVRVCKFLISLHKITWLRKNKKISQNFKSFCQVQHISHVAHRTNCFLTEWFELTRKCLFSPLSHSSKQLISSKPVGVCGHWLATFSCSRWFHTSQMLINFLSNWMVKLYTFNFTLIQINSNRTIDSIMGWGHTNAFSLQFRWQSNSNIVQCPNDRKFGKNLSNALIE